jgi:hypothetical protein
MDTEPITGSDGAETIQDGIDWLYWAKFVCIVAITAALGLFIFNQFIEWKYSAQFLGGPCKLCVDLNPEWQQCYNYVTQPRVVPRSVNLTHPNYFTST